MLHNIQKRAAYHTEACCITYRDMIKTYRNMTSSRKRCVKLSLIETKENVAQSMKEIRGRGRKHNKITLQSQKKSDSTKLYDSLSE